MTNKQSKVHFVVEKTIHNKTITTICCDTKELRYNKNIAYTYKIREVTCGVCIDSIQSDLDCAKRRRQD